MSYLVLKILSDFSQVSKIHNLMAYSMHFDLMAYIIHFVSSCIQKDAMVQTQRTQSVRPPLIGTSFRLGHVLQLCPSWLHNLRCTFLPPSFHGEVLGCFPPSSISFLICVETGRPLSRINWGLGMTLRVSLGSNHDNLSFNVGKTGAQLWNSVFTLQHGSMYCSASCRYLIQIARTCEHGILYSFHFSHVQVLYIKLISCV